MATAENKVVSSASFGKRLVRLCGEDLQTLQNEITKVCAYVGTGEIQREYLRSIVTVNTEEQVFSLSKALIGGQYEKAYQIVDYLMAQNEEPVGACCVVILCVSEFIPTKCMVQSGRNVSGVDKLFRL